MQERVHSYVLPGMSFLTGVLTTLPTCHCRWAFEAIVLAAGLMPDAELSVAVVGVLLNIGPYPNLQLSSMCLINGKVARVAICTKMHSASIKLSVVLEIHAAWTWLCTADAA